MISGIQVIDKVNNDIAIIERLGLQQESIVQTEKYLESEKKLNKQHEKGKLTALERVELIFDNKNYIETGRMVKHNSHNFDMQKKRPLGDGVITACGDINKQKVFIASQDFLVNGGSLGYMHAEKICNIVELAIRNQAPIVFINDSGGARIQEGVDSLAGYGQIFYLNVKASGLIPQIAMIMGPCAGGAVYSPALTDFIFMVKNTSYMYLTGPSIVKAVTYEDVTHDTLGGAAIHGQKSGVADFVCENDVDAIFKLKLLLSYLPRNSYETPSKLEHTAPIIANDYLNNFLPENKNQPYDMVHLINEIVDDSSFLEVKKDFAANILTGFARLNGHSIGIIANQPLVLAGALDINASEKAAKFIRFCDSFNIPIISLVDVPGFLPGTNQEYNGVITHGAKLLYAYSEATVPKITMIIRKAYGGAYIVMNSKHLGADFNFAWSNSEIAVMGGDGATDLLVKDKTNLQALNNFKNEYAELSSPEYSASRGFIDDIISPADSRKVLGNALEISSEKLKNKILLGIKHKNIPL